MMTVTMTIRMMMTITMTITITMMIMMMTMMHDLTRETTYLKYNVQRIGAGLFETLLRKPIIYIKANQNINISRIKMHLLFLVWL